MFQLLRADLVDLKGMPSCVHKHVCVRGELSRRHVWGKLQRSLYKILCDKYGLVYHIADDIMEQSYFANLKDGYEKGLLKNANDWYRNVIHIDDENDEMLQRALEQSLPPKVTGTGCEGVKINSTTMCAHEDEVLSGMGVSTMDRQLGVVTGVNNLPRISGLSNLLPVADSITDSLLQQTPPNSTQLDHHVQSEIEEEGHNMAESENGDLEYKSKEVN